MTTFSGGMLLLLLIVDFVVADAAAAAAAPAAILVVGVGAAVAHGALIGLCDAATTFAIRPGATLSIDIGLDPPDELVAVGVGVTAS